MYNETETADLFSNESAIVKLPDDIYILYGVGGANKSAVAMRLAYQLSKAQS